MLYLENSSQRQYVEHPATGQQLGTNSSCRRGDKLVVNRLETFRRVRCFGLQRLSFVCASEEIFRMLVLGVSSVEDKWSFFGHLSRSRSALPYPTSPRSACRWDSQVLDFTGNK